jgi:hypothetical protein
MDPTGTLLGIALGALACALVAARLSRANTPAEPQPVPQVLDLSEPDRAAIERLTAGMRQLSGQMANRRAEPPKLAPRQQPQAPKAKPRKR